MATESLRHELERYHIHNGLQFESLYILRIHAPHHCKSA